MNPKVDFFFIKADQWHNEFNKLREIVLGSELHEELKWGVPCYTFHSKNVVLIHGFKEYCALLFHKGVLINDTEDILIQQTENVQSARQLRFSGLEEIVDLETIIRSYILQAIEIERSGRTVEFKKTAEFPLPDEFKIILEEDEEVKVAFKALTPGRQRGYLLFFSQPKQSKTRESRIEKCIPKILSGKGLND